MKIDEKGLLNTSDEKGRDKMNTALLSSKRMTWGTPPELFAWTHTVFARRWKQRGRCPVPEHDSGV